MQEPSTSSPAAASTVAELAESCSQALEDERERFARELHDDRTSPSPPLDEKHARYETLSEREVEVFKAVALGYRNSEIAEMPFLSVKTIETYKARLMQKLGVHSRAELVRYALELDILE